MTARTLVLVGNGLDTRGLAAALKPFDIALGTIERGLRHDAPCDEPRAAHLLSRSGPFDGVLLAPAFVDGPDGPTVDDLLDVLTSCFSVIKAAIASFEERAVAGRVIALLPGGATMGEPGEAINSALAGAMLSLFRTVALEMRSTPVTVNTLVYATRAADGPTGGGVLGDPEALACMIASLLGSGARGINGQEIYALAGADVGRLHP
ncbi:SDR family oxidoreductase [Azospirillum sp. Sh1]|uniref:SDR family oxidoreductase n=1 Tax=Azospirillum sp. Sh1 TaxID=2607285 RepID=UPI0011EEC87C|nr:SDR family oxidoreductase [Azospirillum sp. Sh1]KAA0571519.1 SDR family oxidoreductase [Azospirillum sp. Sh1]